MSAKSKRILCRPRKSSIRNSPLVSTVNREVKNSVASESDSGSFPPVFTDDEVVFTETKKKKARRTRKVRNTEDLRDYFKEPKSVNSVDSDTDLRRGEIKSTNALSEIFLARSKNVKKKKKPLFCLPDVTYELKSGSTDTADESVNTFIKKAKSKRKIRYTQDLNAIANDQSDSDVAANPKPKRTKKARLPSFLPQVDIADEKKQLDRSNLAVTDSDNKENDTNTESTDSEKYSRKSTRKSKRRLVKNKEKVSLEGVPSDDINKSKNARKSKNNTFEIIHSPNKGSTSCNYENHKVTEEPLTQDILLKTNTSRFSAQKSADTPNKTGNTSDFNDESAALCLEEISLKQDVPSVRKSSRKSAFNMTSDLAVTSDKSKVVWFNTTRKSVPNLEFSKTSEHTALKTESSKRTKLEETSDEPDSTHLIETRRSTRNRTWNRTIESVPEFESLSTVSESTTNVVNSRTSTRTSNTTDKRSTFELESGSELSNGNSKSVNLDDPFEPAINQGSFNNESSKNTYDIVSSTRSTMTPDEKPAVNITVIDLTESPLDDSMSRPSKRATRTSLDKDTPDKRKSSFEVSFQAKKDRRNPEKLLDHLNITRRDSGKSRSTGLKYSTGSDGEDGQPRKNYVTLRRPRACHTMIDFDTGDSLGAAQVVTSEKGGLRKFKNLANLNGIDDDIVLSDKISPEEDSAFSLTNTSTKGLSPKNVSLKKSIKPITRSIRRDTYEIAECFYESLTAGTVSLKTDVKPVVKEAQPQRDIFELVSNTPTVELGKMLIGSDESFIMDSSILNVTNRSTMPRLTRTSTYTKLEQTPLPTRKSTRKKWSQVDRTSISDLLPKENASINVSNQLTNSTLDITVNQSKSVTIKTPVFSPRKRWNKTTPKQAKAGERGKSVQIETPLNTPKIRAHSPLVMRKTPGPSFSGADDSIVSGNFCAYNPPKTSTPHPKKKDVSLLKRVLTNEESKSEKSVGKTSVRSKMPNFSKIHQRQNEKLENLKEMLERKAVRAQYLLSGSKPPANTSASNFFDKESRKQLKFSPNKAETAKTVANISGLTVGQAKSKGLSKPLQRMLDKRVSLEKKKKKPMKSKVPVAVAKPAQVPKAEPKPPTKPQSKNVTRFGFKLPSGKERFTKDEQIKAVTTKSKITANRTETNRKQLVGVRSNRRFELLMKMRENKNKTNTVSSRGFIYEPKKQFNVRPLKANPPMNRPQTSNGTKLVSKPVQHMLNKRALQEKNSKQGKSKIPVHIVRSRATLPKVIKGSLDQLAKGFTRFNFKVPRGKENVTKAELIKAVTVKSKIARDITEENRYQLRKVRGNRRFELLMTLRDSNSKKIVKKKL